MPLEDPNVIDIIRVAADGKAVLVISDAGITVDPAKRLDLLGQKLKSCVSAIISGELKGDFPNHTAKDYIVEIICAHPPTPEMASIVEVTPRGDPANAIPVQYAEYPEGAWSDSVPTDEPTMPTGTKAEEDPRGRHPAAASSQGPGVGLGRSGS